MPEFHHQLHFVCRTPVSIVSGRWKRCQVEFYARWAWLLPSWSQWNFCHSFQNQQDSSSARSLFLLLNHRFLIFSGTRAHQFGIHTRLGFITTSSPDSFKFEQTEENKVSHFFFFFLLANLDWMLQVCQRLLEFSLTKVWVKAAAVWNKQGCWFSLVLLFIHWKGTKNICRKLFWWHLLSCLHLSVLLTWKYVVLPSVTVSPSPKQSLVPERFPAPHRELPAPCRPGAELLNWMESL